MELSESGRAGFTFCGKIDYSGMPPFLGEGLIVVMEDKNIGLLFPVAPDRIAGVKGVEHEDTSPFDSFGLEEYAMEPVSFQMQRPMIDLIMESLDNHGDLQDMDDDDELVWSTKVGFINMDDGNSFRTIVLVPPQAIERHVEKFIQYLQTVAAPNGGLYLEVERAA